MADRATLAISRLDAFTTFMRKRDFVLVPSPESAEFEILRFRKFGERTVTIYRKNRAQVHVTVQDKDRDLLEAFIAEGHHVA